MVTAASAAHSGQSKVYRPGARLSSVTLCKQFGQKTSIGWSSAATDVFAKFCGLARVNASALSGPLSRVHGVDDLRSASKRLPAAL
jgi:hypothetical protein